MKLPAVRLLPLGYLVVLLMSCAATGWLLAEFRVPWFVWVGTLGMMLHLLKVGADAIAPASAWIVVLISTAAVAKAWAPALNAQLPYENAKAWAMGLLGLWLWATGVATGLAFSEASMQWVGLKRSLHQMMLVGFALGCGWLINSVMRVGEP